MTERIVCTYCGKEGHRASRCPARHFGLFVALRNILLAYLVAGIALGRERDVAAGAGL